MKCLAVTAQVGNFSTNQIINNTVSAPIPQNGVRDNIVERFGIYYQHTARPGGGDANGATTGMGSANVMNGDVNIMLGGAMMSFFITVVCVVCYCCHRSIRKRTEAALRQRWMETDANMEVYSVEQCYETSGLFMETTNGLPSALNVPPLVHEPPPSYDAVVNMGGGATVQPSPPPVYRPRMNLQSDLSQHTQLHHLSDSRCSLQRTVVELNGNQAAAFNTVQGCTLSSSDSFAASIVDTFCQIAKTDNIHNSNDYFSGCPLCGKFSTGNSLSPSTSGSLDNESYNISVGEAQMSPTDSCECRSLKEIDGNFNNVLEISEPLSPLNMESEDCNANFNEHLLRSQPSTSQSTTLEVTENNNNLAEHPPNSMNLNSINDNGFIRLDMTKMIDKTGLPTYEAALKLESSGYV